MKTQTILYEIYVIQLKKETLWLVSQNKNNQCFMFSHTQKKTLGTENKCIQ